MKAICVHEWGGPEVLRLEEVDEPRPGPGEAVVRVEAVGVNPVETYIRAGTYPQLPPLPHIPGGDAGGVVEAVGDGVTEVASGQHVYIAGCVGGRLEGCYAEKVARPAAELFPLPDGVSFAAGAAMGVPYATAYRGLFLRGRAKPGETVFVHGASGAVGVAAIQLARARGLMVIGSAGSDRGRELALQQGAHFLVDHTADGYIDEVRELTGGQGPELILEMLANVNLNEDLSLVARYGRIVVIGNRGTIEINPRIAMMREVDVMGLALWNCTEAEFASIHAALVAGLTNRTLAPVIGRELPLAKAARAHEAVLAPGAFGKIVLLP